MITVIPTQLYRLTSPSGKQYVGVTKQDIETRITGHIQCRKTVISKALRKYGRDSFKKEILVVGPEDYIYNLEQRVIEISETKVPKGYNLKDGGQGGRHSEESKQKMSEIRVGIIFSEEHKRNISKVKTGLKVSKDTRQKMSESQKRRRENESVVVRQKFSETMKRVRARGGAR